jgi:hypothetical protein
MANEIPQIQETQPILQTQKVASKSTGYEEFAKTLGSLSEQVHQTAEKIVSEQSKTMLMQSVADSESVKTNAQVEMLQHPEDSLKILMHTSEQLAEINKNAYVNKKDRRNLVQYNNNHLNQLEIKAVSADLEFRKREAAFVHYENFPNELKAYQEALMTDHDRAEELHNAMIGSLHGLFSTGVITPHELSASINTMSKLVENTTHVHEQLEQAGYGNLSAKDFHTLTSNPINQNTNHPGSPVNQDTQWMVDYYNSDKSFQGMQADVQNRILPNPATFMKAKDSQRQQLIEEIHGVKIADGIIKSGEPYPAIEHAYQALSEKGRILSYRDKATRDAIGIHLKELNNGNMLSEMEKSPDGNEILQRFNLNNSVLNNLRNNEIKGISNPELINGINAKYSQMMAQNENNRANEAVSWAQARHIPGDKIQPISQAQIAVVEDAFKPGHNPADILTVLSQYDKTNQMYVAQAMKNPDQRMTVQAVALLPDNIKPQDKLDFIAAQQPPEPGAKQPKVEQAVSDKTMNTKIYTLLKDSMALVQSNYDREQSPQLQASMLNTTLNYAKKIAINKGDYLMKDWRSHVMEASQIYANSFQKMSGTNWVVNPQQAPENLTNSEWDIMADHVTSEGYKYLQEGRQRFELESAQSRNPLIMIISSTNEMQAVDGNGKVYYSMPFTTNFLPYAKESKKRREEELKKELEHGFATDFSELLPEAIP